MKGDYKTALYACYIQESCFNPLVLIQAFNIISKIT